jgi:homoserine dehydrogenase
MSRAPIRVVVLGAGTVGRAVIDGLVARGDRLAAADGARLQLVGIAVRDLARGREPGLPEALRPMPRPTSWPTRTVTWWSRRWAATSPLAP